MLRGIDISSWQEGLNIESTGADFVICKATQGTGYVNPIFKSQHAEAKSLGKKLGLYHYAGGNDPIEEAKFFIENIKEYIGEALIALDWEVGENARFSEHADWCMKFLNYVYEETGVRPLVYMSASVLKLADWNPVMNANYGLWLAGYPDLRDSWDAPDFIYDPTPWQSCAIWQYTSSNGHLDRNLFYGDAEAWDKYAKSEKKQEETMENIHDLGLQDRFFKYIQTGTKRIELRLYDEKRQKINVGDIVRFTSNETGEKMEKKVIGLLRYDSFENLFKDFPIRLMADRSWSKAELLDVLEEFYTKEKQAQYGVVGIRLD